VSVWLAKVLLMDGELHASYCPQPAP